MGMSASAFDAHRPPARERLDDCVHCGFCLPACPTYDLWGQEMDSPRGRIDLMNLAERGEVALDGIFVRHIDACLGCMACVTACPSGVRYDELIEATRAQVERNHRRTLLDRWFRALVFWLFPHPARLRAAAVLAWLYQRLGLRALLARTGVRERLPVRLRALESLMPPVSLGDVRRRFPEHVVAHGRRRLRAGLLTGCVQSTGQPHGSSPWKAATSSPPGPGGAAAPWPCTPAGSPRPGPPPGRQSRSSRRPGWIAWSSTPPAAAPA
jgi:glycolate oxidase iron-sulfur subunit